ncbi:hypothetical protein EDD21DRAFT_393634 [Dissophora ornata]|nr:hypothetical protein EDD21DRAFT_393634 [Dissophora ornata]
MTTITAISTTATATTTLTVIAIPVSIARVKGIIIVVTTTLADSGIEAELALPLPLLPLLPLPPLPPMWLLPIRKNTLQHRNSTINGGRNGVIPGRRGKGRVSGHRGHDGG